MYGSHTVPDSSLSYCRYWDKEVLRAKKDARKPSLTKAIIKCYWKSYLILGIFTLIEVNVSHILAAVSEWVYQEEARCADCPSLLE